MRNLEKLKYEIIGMEETLKKKPNPKLFNKLTGLRFKLLRLEQGMTAEAVVQDNKIYFNTVYDLYKFEKGIKTDVSKLFALTKYYDDTDAMFSVITDMKLN
tara:strand:+ start:83 stop:385 length:303 start_codon:yes stop_codon:yes gene_type:complete